jgi:hypothetical protein
MNLVKHSYPLHYINDTLPNPDAGLTREAVAWTKLPVHYGNLAALFSARIVATQIT